MLAHIGSSKARFALQRLLQERLDNDRIYFDWCEEHPSSRGRFDALGCRVYLNTQNRRIASLGESPSELVDIAVEIIEASN
jgi:hypothetical protein